MEALSADVLLLVPLEQEFEAVCRVMHFERIPQRDCPPVLPRLFIHRTSENLCVVACLLLEMANENSAMLTERCLHYLRPKLVVGLGIAGSLDPDALLGDVVVSRTVDGVYFESKAVPDDRTRSLDTDKSAFMILPSANRNFPPPSALVDFVGTFKTCKAAEYEAWQAEGAAARESLNLRTETLFIQKDGSKRMTAVARVAPSMLLGAIASGPSVGASSAYVAHLKSVGRDFRVLEMEGAGIAFCCSRRGKVHNFLLIRGVSDFSDERKSELEARSRGGWRKVAAENAARFLKILLDDDEFRVTSSLSGDDTRQVVRIAIVGNDTVHYVNSIDQAFRNAVGQRLNGSGFAPVYAHIYGSPEESAAEVNRAAVEAITREFGSHRPDYVITIGTAVTQAAFDTLGGGYKLIFLGVSDPESVGLNKPRSDPECPTVTGVRYGLPVDLTIEKLQYAFPGRRLVYVYAAGQYAQDTSLKAGIQARFPAIEILEMTEPGPLPEQENAVFFGRFFFCRNIAAFARSNPTAILVGVSRDNIGRGAAMAIGYSAEAVGELGAELLAGDWGNGPKLTNARIVSPETVNVTASRTRLAHCGVEISPDVAAALDLKFIDER